METLQVVFFPLEPGLVFCVFFCTIEGVFGKHGENRVDLDGLNKRTGTCFYERQLQADLQVEGKREAVLTVLL